MTSMIGRLWNEKLDLYKHSVQEDHELRELEALIESNLKILKESADKKQRNDWNVAMIVLMNIFMYLKNKRFAMALRWEQELSTKLL